MKPVLHLLREGEDGTQQPAAVKRKLRELEADGYVRYVGGGWRLTERGRRVVAPSEAKTCDCAGGSPSFDAVTGKCVKCGLPLGRS